MLLNHVHFLNSNDKSIFFLLGWSATESTVIDDATGLLWQPQMTIDDDGCGAICRMFGGGNRSTQRKLAPLPLCPPQISHT
jgi:hypothetical protein